MLRFSGRDPFEVKGWNQGIDAGSPPHILGHNRTAKAPLVPMADPWLTNWHRSHSTDHPIVIPSGIRYIRSPHFRSRPVTASWLLPAATAPETVFLTAGLPMSAFESKTGRTLFFLGLTGFQTSSLRRNQGQSERDRCSACASKQIPHSGEQPARDD
jgi:hypothetical protein